MGLIWIDGNYTSQADKHVSNFMSCQLPADKDKTAQQFCLENILSLRLSPVPLCTLDLLFFLVCVHTFFMSSIQTFCIYIYKY